MKITFEDGGGTVEWNLPEISVKREWANFLERNKDIACIPITCEVSCISEVTDQLRTKLTSSARFSHLPGCEMPDPIRAIVALLFQVDNDQKISIDTILESPD